MKFIYIFILFISTYCVTFDDAISKLSLLEKYTKDYMSSTEQSMSLNGLILSYIRSLKYAGTEWTIAAGDIPKELIAYIEKVDQEQSTNVQDIRNYGDITLPSNDIVDFAHMFAAMNGIDHNDQDYQSAFAGLTGWAGDTAQLLQDIKDEKGDLEALTKIASDLLGGPTGQYGEGDLIGNFDAVNLLKLRYASSDTDFATLYKEYCQQEYKNRVSNFIKETFPTLVSGSSKDDFRNKIFTEYSSNLYIKILECQYGVRTSLLSCFVPGDLIPGYENHQKAAVYAFADYLFDKTH